MIRCQLYREYAGIIHRIYGQSYKELYREYMVNYPGKPGWRRGIAKQRCREASSRTKGTHQVAHTCLITLLMVMARVKTVANASHCGSPGERSQSLGVLLQLWARPPALGCVDCSRSFKYVSLCFQMLLPLF